MRRDFDTQSGLLDDAHLSNALRSLPPRMPPAGLRASLRAMASRECAVRERSNLRAAGLGFADRFSLWANNLMRPLALPFAGGILSALGLFSIWLTPTYPLRADTGFDVPVGLPTEAAIVGTFNIGVSSPDVVVDVYLDGDRFVDYKVVSGELTNAELRRLQNVLVFSRFVPARSFGVPRVSKIRVSLISSSIDVRG